MKIGENRDYTYPNEYSTFSIESHERSADFQPIDQFVNDTECSNSSTYSCKHILLSHTIL